LAVRCLPTLPGAVEQAAKKASTTPSEYARRAIVDRLRTDGIDPAALQSA
jgi:hypothetical protein